MRKDLNGIHFPGNIRANDEGKRVRDVVVYGAGRTGIAIAQLLLEQGIGVRIIEAHRERAVSVAERLPKALIHHNVPGHPVHALIGALDDAWRAAAAYATFGPRQRWTRAVAGLRAEGWPVLDRPSRWRLGELTVAWSAVSEPQRPR